MPSKKKSSSVSLSPDTWQIIYVVVGVAIVGTLVWFFCRPPPPRSSFTKTTDRTCDPGDGENVCRGSSTGGMGPAPSRPGLPPPTERCFNDTLQCIHKWNPHPDQKGIVVSEWECTDSQGSCNVKRKCVNPKSPVTYCRAGPRGHAMCMDDQGICNLF